VREHYRRGANVIKLMPSGGIASTGDNPHAQTMTDAEILEAVRTAMVLGLKVAAHFILRSPFARRSMRASILVEHGSFADAEAYQAMKAHGTYLVPTLSVFDVYYAAARDHPEKLMIGTAQKELANDLFPKQHFPNAVKAGVKIAFGTDLGEGDHAMEFDLMVANGLPAGDAILAATSRAADLLGASEDIGSLAADAMPTSSRFPAIRWPTFRSCTASPSS
jgi:imidazolonepropionase-like amidohydrolase